MHPREENAEDLTEAISYHITKDMFQIMEV